MAQPNLSRAALKSPASAAITCCSSRALDCSNYSRESYICAREVAGRGQVCDLEMWRLSQSPWGWDVSQSSSQIQYLGQGELRSPRLKANNESQRDLGWLPIVKRIKLKLLSL